MSRAAPSALPATSPATRVAAPLAALFGCLALLACQNGSASPGGGIGSIGGGLGNADAATRAACTQHAEQVYDQRNRAEIYMPQSSVNSPYSGNYNPGATDRGLSDLYARNSMIRDCVRNTGTETSRDVPPQQDSGAVTRP
ncbi:MAG: hypothetical protein P4L71_06790 [Acetobacteraceae bacterium]|nr:hypothetical protein [Acetobacteraceae bacterium]